MPKGKKKGRTDRSRGEGSLQTSDDDSYPNDNLSVASNVSEHFSVEDTNEVDDFAQDQLEEKLAELIDGLAQKSSQGRTNCFKNLTAALVKKYMPLFIRERTFTLCDCIERSVKKGGPEEKGAAADLATVMCVQLGTDPIGENIYAALKPILLATALDNSAAPHVRAQCCLALGNMTFLSSSDLGENLLLMRQLETIFSGSYLKGDGSVPNTSPENGAMHAAALNAWSLLFTLMVPGNIGTMINNSKSLPDLSRLSELLESAHLEVRLAAGEALALIYEIGREESDEFEDEFADSLIGILKQLATDSHKYRAKKERKQQRATFRDILLYIEDIVTTDVQVKFGKEVLLLDTWVKRKQYEALCNFLGPSINNHLVENDVIKDLFQIEASVDELRVPAHAQHQMEKNRKRILNAANDKARTLSRAKNRDKRSDF
uniref:Interferon-related developmental regulator N-terminal domain-containing protein n=1 Tax=Dendroctonus ponderosae TaxID=77166 RepID=J3JX95_DENPD|nr:unknown [Dendroctonus ponderosae]